MVFVGAKRTLPASTAPKMADYMRLTAGYGVMLIDEDINQFSDINQFCDIVQLRSFSEARS